MYIKKESRKDSKGKSYRYYRLWESYRDELGLSQKRPVLGLGRMDGFNIRDLADFIVLLDIKIKGNQSIFPYLYSTIVTDKAEEVYAQLVAQKKIDAIDGSKTDCSLSEFRKKQEQRFIVKASTIVHKDVREVGAEHLCLETVRRLKIDKILKQLGFTDSQIILALTQIVARAVHPASELTTVDWIKKSSEICLLTGLDADSLTKDHLYGSALHLYKVQDGLRNHLSRWTKELFCYDDSIILYDLTNTYFEGSMENSQVCYYGQSKEKRYDCKQIVLALVVNQLGFPKHYQLFEGNMSDSKSFPLIIDSLDSHIKELGVTPTIVMDAGISSEENLQLLRKRGYKFLCVSRSSSKVYELKQDAQKIKVQDKQGQPIELQSVTVKGATEGDNFFWVRSYAKAAKENIVCTSISARVSKQCYKPLGLLYPKNTALRKHQKYTNVSDVPKLNIRAYRPIMRSPLQRTAKRKMSTTLSGK